MSTPTPTEAADHERIWLEPLPGDYHGRQWCQDKVWPSDDGEPEPTEYVRADIHAAALALIESQRATIEKQAGLLHSNGKPRFNEAMRRAEAAEARVTALEAEKAKAIHALDLALDSDRQTDIREAIAIRAALSRSTEKNDG